MAGDEQQIRRKHHRSSPDDGVEEGSKRRKNHHSHGHRHHHHHRSHRHRSSKHDDQKSDGDNLPHPPPPPAIVTSDLRPVDDDKEEGEILEEEEDFPKKADSDVESGEIKSDELNDDISDLKSIPAAKSYDNREEGLNNDLPHGSMLTECVYDEMKLNSANDAMGEALNVVCAIDEVVVNGTAKSTLQHKTCEYYHVEVDENLMGKSNRSKDESKHGRSKMKVEKGLISPEGDEWNRQKGGISPVEALPSIVYGETEYKSFKEDKKCMGSRSPLEGSAEENCYRGADSSNLQRHMMSASPVSKHRKKDDHRKKENHSRDMGNLGQYESERHSESIDASKNNLANRNRSMSPRSSKDKYKALERSPSHDKYHEEAHYRKRSRSPNHVRERNSRFRDTTHERGSQPVRSHDRDSKSYIDDLRENTRNDSDPERGLRRDREGRHDKRDRLDMDKVMRSERERSLSSYSLHGGREDRHESRDRDREKRKEREKERERERERDRERDRIREKDKVRDRSRDREQYRDRDRDMEKDRISRYHKYGGAEDSRRGRDRYNDSRHSKFDELEHNRDKTRGKEVKKEPLSTRHDTETGKDTRDEDEDEEYEEKVLMKLAEKEEEDIDRIKEESRKRRQAILEKYKPKQSPVQVELRMDVSQKEDKASLDEKPSGCSTSPDAVTDSANQMLPEVQESKNDSSDVYVADSSFAVGKSPLQNGTSVFERNLGVGGLGDGTPKSERSTDMFCDDIFGDSPAGVRKQGKGDGLQVERGGLHDNWDDAEGYYCYRFGEVLDGRYEITAAHGKGVFSIVVRARDLKAGRGDPEEVAIKIIRNNETMYKAGQDELVILKKLAGADPEDKRHCVRFLSSFKYRNHLCLVFESLHMNLREVLKKFGRNIGLKLTAVRAYAKQLFIALKHLRNCGVLHCDIKPDNMLVNEAKNVLKLCDFGNAMLAGKNDITPYLVSRFYRAPEIILGLPYDHPLDMWSVGCCLYELYSGKVLFPGQTNNDMLRLHMELKGPFPKKMLKKGAFTPQHFDQDFNFHATEEDLVTKKTVKRLLLNIKPKDIGSLVTGSPGEDPKMLTNFKDLLERIFVLDPEKRMTVSQALSHPFITAGEDQNKVLGDEACNGDVGSGDLPWRFLSVGDVFCFYWFLPVL